MNRIKHFMILALALAMSLGAWAQQEVLLTTVTATGETSYSQSPDGIVTVTLNNIGYYDDYQYGWLGGTVTVEANQGYTITRCVFRQQNTGSIEDDLAPFTATMSGYSTDNVSVETSNGHVNGDADQMIGITSIEVYGYAADASPTVTHNTDGSWGFTMPDYNAALNVTYYSLPDLAWTYNSAAMPAAGLTAYRGFELPVIGGIGASMDQDFLNALLGGTVSLRYGSVNGVVTFNNPNDMRSFNVNGPGRDTIYMVFAGNDDFLYDSASFAINILDPDTLTLAANGNGTVSALLGGGNATWGDGTDNIVLSNQFTADDITFTINSGGDITPSGQLLGSFSFTSENGNFSRIEMTLTSNYNYTYWNNAEGWTVDANTAVWEGDANEVVIESCTTYVKQITFVRGGSTDIVALNEAQDTLLVLPGATVQVVAEAQDGNYVSAWSDNRQPQHYTSDTNTITVNETMTLTATFNEIPVLTLASNNSEWGSVKLDGVTPGATTYDITIEGGNTYTNVTFPFQTTVFLHEGLYDVGAQDPLSVVKDGNNAVITISEPYGGTRTVSYMYINNEDFIGGNKSISCQSVESAPTIPAGVEQLTDNTYRVLPGTEVTVNATPDEAHYFVNWDEETALNSNTAVEKTLTMGTAPATLTANFQAKPTLTLAQNDGGEMEIVPAGMVSTGIVQLTDNTYRMDYGTEVKAIATANAGYHMDSWSNQDEVAGLVSDTTETITMTEDMTITATFAQNPTLTIVSNNSEWGSLDIEGVGSGKDKFVTDANQLVYTGRHVKVTATDLYDIGVIRLKNEGQQATIETLNGEIIDSIVVTASMNTHNCSYVLSTSGTVQGGNPTTKIKDVNATSVVLTAQYGVGISNITVYYTSPDKIDVVAIDYESGTYSVLPGTEVSVNATANEGYYVTGWQDENNSDMATATYSEGLYPVTSTLTFTVTGDTTSMAIFEQSFISPEFAWSTETFTAYTMIDFNSWKPTLNNPQDLTVRYGCVEGSVITEGGIPVDETTGIIGSELGIGTVSTKAGTYHIYAVHDFDGNYDYDSVVYTLIVENSATVFVQKNIEEGGAVDFVEPENDLTHNYMNSAALKSVFLAPGADFSVTNTAAEGYHFAKWQTGDNVNGYTDYSTEPNLTYTAPTEFAGSFVEGLKAVFDTNVYNVAYNVQNDTRPQIGTNAPMGSVVLEGQHKHFLNDVLTATAAEGYIFAGWANASGTVVSTENPFLFSPVSDTTLTATFIVGDYTLSATPNIPTSGQVTGSGSYAYSSDATLEVVPTTGYHLVEWTDAAGNVLGTEPTLTVNVMSDTTVIAVLDTNVYNVAYNVQNDTRPQIGTNAPMGSVVLEGQHKHFLNDVLTATAADGYIFAGWANASGTVVSTANPLVFSPVSDTTLTATFIVGDYTLSATPNIPTSGIVTGIGSYAYRSTVTLEATPSTGYHFVNWVDGSGNVLGTNNELSVQILSDVSVTAVFDTNIYNVAYNVQNDIRPQIGTNAPMGSVVLEGQHKHFLNDVLTATAADGYIFTGWANASGTVVSTLNPFAFSPVSDTTLTATFTASNYTLSATPNIPTSGQVTGSGSYAYRSNATLEVVPSAGYHLVEWTDAAGNVLGTEPTLTVNVMSDTTVIAVLDTNVYNVTANVNIVGLGTVTGAGQVKHFLSTDLVATANPGYHFVNWIDNAGNELGTANTITVFPVSDTVLTAVFEANIYTTVWSGNTTTTYNSQPYTGLVATYTDFWGNEHTPMLTFTNGSTTITTPNYPVNAGTWTVTATGEVGDVLTNTVNTLVINPAVVYVSNAVVETAKFVDGNTDAVVTNIGTLNNVQGNDVVTHNTTAVFNDATVGEGKTITLTYSLNGDSELLANYNLDPVTQVYTTNAYIIEPMTPDTNRVSTEDTTVVEEGMDIYAYGYCSGSTYSIRYHLNSGNPDQYKIDFADNRFTDVDWTDLAIAGTDGTIDIEVPVDLPTGDYTLTVTFRDSRFTWLESKPISVSFHVNLPETYTVVLFDNVIALVDTCHCFTDIQWYHRADASSDWYAIPGANGYYYHATDAQLKGEFFVKVRMNGIETYTCPQTDMETLYSDNEQSVSVKAYPNPTTERVTIAISGSMEPVHKLRIINNLGVEMESSTFEGDSTVINMSNYQQGNYMVTVDGAVVIVIRN